MEPTRAPQRATGWTGWIAFAAIIMMINGIFGIIQGLSAVAKDDFYVVTDEHLVTFDVTAWGWIHMALGALLIAVGAGLMTGARWAQLVAVFLVSIHMVAQFAFLSAFPAWAIVTIAIDALVLWALIVHGNEVLRDNY